MPDFINQGEFAIIREGQLEAYLQTCCGLIYHANGIIGFAHSIVPSESEYYFRRGYLIENDKELPQEFLVTPTQTAEKLLEEILAQETGAPLKAYIFGCQMEESKIGLKNADEIKKVLKQLKIPVRYDFTELPFDTKLIITPEKINITLCNSPFTKDLTREIKLK